MTTEAFSRLEAAMGEIQRQLDALAAAHDARAEAGQIALDDLRDIVCDPTNARNHESRLTAVETRQDRTEQDLRSAARERRGILDSIPSGKEIGEIGVGVRKVGLYGVLVILGFALVYLLVFGDPITAFERVWDKINPPVKVEVTSPVPVVPALPDTTQPPPL